MLTQINLTHFRRHEDLTISFKPGLNAIRAANEGGKSTILEAIAYALFGSRVLRSTLEDTVSWGKPLNSLRVTLTLEVEGRTYTFTRGKSGAEVIENGAVFVTGQNECSNFAAKILGADIAVAGKLMFAHQGNLRGSLEAGPKATAELIETLADFDLFNRLLDAAQERLMVGSASVLEANLAHAQNQLDGFEVPPVVEESAIRLDIKRRLAAEADLTQRHADAKALADRTYADFSQVKAGYEAIAQSVEQQRLLTEQRQSKQADLEATLATLADDQAIAEADHALAELETRLQEIDHHQQRFAAYTQFKGLVPAALTWEGNKASFDAEVTGKTAQRRDLEKRLADLEKQTAVLESTLITASVCGFCGQDVSAFPEVARKNNETQAIIITNRQVQGRLQSDLARVVQDLADLAKVTQENERIQKAARSLADYLTLDETTIPPTLAWQGDPPDSTPPDRKPLLAQISAAKSAREDQRRSQVRATLLREELQALDTRLATVNDRLQAHPTISKAALDAAQALADDAAGKHILLLSELETQKAARVKIETDLITALERQAFLMGQRDLLAKAVEQCQANLKALHFNNALVKKIRAARPLIGDKLWTMVLASVSTMFTAMRGERSLVSKDKDGFRVNGQDVTGLSGSTLDLLGLAIRIALVRTFLPTCPFIVLDEPAAACDVSRSAAMLGFLQSCGFTQTLMVTHDEASDAVADNLIQL